MMTVTKRVTVGDDGVLVIPLGGDVAGATVQVTVERVRDAESAQAAAERRARLEALAGSIDDPNFRRPPQPHVRPWPEEDE